MLGEFRYASRTLLKTPGFTAVAVLTLALGIGLCTTMFSALNPILFRPLPFPRPQELVAVNEANADARLPIAYADYKDFQEQNKAFENSGIWISWEPTIGDAGEGGELQRVDSARVSASLFSTLGVNPILGRHFNPAEERPGADAVVMIGQSLWQIRFGSDSNIVGRTLRVDGEPMTIIGVMPAGFGFPSNTELWSPLVVPSPEKTRDNHSWSAVARLKPGVTVEQATADLSSISKRLSDAFPATNTGVRPALRSLREDLLGRDASSGWMILAAVGFVLAVACVNVANLFLARAMSRHKEFAIRAALGATRWQTVRQLLVEGMLLAAIAGAVGYSISGWGLQIVLSLMQRRPPSYVQFDVDWRVQLFAIGISLLTCLIFALVPAWRASAVSVQDGLKEGNAAAGHGHQRGRLRAALVVIEVALAVFLLAGAGLMIRSVMNLQQVQPGFNSERMLVCSFDLPGRPYDSAEKRAAFFATITDRLASLPGVQSAAAASSLPMSGRNIGISFIIDGRPPVLEGQEPDASTRVVTPGYFTTMQIPILRGREFTPADTDKAPRVAIIEDNVVKKYFPGEDPIGKRIKLGTGPWLEIVGVAGDVMQHGLSSRIPAGVYLPHRQNAWNTMSVVVRTNSDQPRSLLPLVRSTVRDLDPGLWFQPDTMDRIIQRSFWSQRFQSQLFSAFSAVALALAGVGIAAVVAYSISQRTREIGIRMAIGAGRLQILRMVIIQGMIPVAIGLSVGLAASLMLTIVLSSQLHGVGKFDPVSLLGSGSLFTFVALIACIIPARRAVKVDPLVALRSE